MAEQKRTDVDWEDLRVFIALARHGSMSAAARALGINHITVSRRMAALESALGQRLVERRPDGYRLTPAGTRVLGPANGMEVLAAAISRGGEADGPSGLVRLNAPPTLSQAFLVRHLAGLVMQARGLDIDLATDVRAVSLERRETDIALRLARPQDGDVIARHLTTMHFGFYASSDWCRAVADQAEPVFVGFDEMNIHLPEAAWLTRGFPRARVSLRSNSQLSQAQAARAGAGIALLPHFVGRADPHLHPCRLAHDPPPREVWMVTRREDRRDPSIQTVAAFLVELFEREQALFAASPPADQAPDSR